MVCHCIISYPISYPKKKNQPFSYRGHSFCPQLAKQSLVNWCIVQNLSTKVPHDKDRHTLGVHGGQTDSKGVEAPGCSNLDYFESCDLAGEGEWILVKKKSKVFIQPFINVTVCDVFLWYISVYVRPVFSPVPLGEHWRMFSVVLVISPCICCVCTFYMCVSSLTLWTHAGGLVMPHSCQSAWSPPTVMLGGPACNRAYSQFTSDRDNDTHTHDIHKRLGVFILLKLSQRKGQICKKDHMWIKRFLFFSHASNIYFLQREEKVIAAVYSTQGSLAAMTAQKMLAVAGRE